MLNLEFWEAWKRGDINDAERDLGFYLACEADFRNGRTTKSLTAIMDDLSWTGSVETARRRLKKLRETEYIAYDVRAGQRRAYTITVTSKLVVRPATATRPPHNSDATSTDSTHEIVEVTSATTSATTSTLVVPARLNEAEQPPQRPPHEPPHDGAPQERETAAREDQTSSPPTEVHYARDNNNADGNDGSLTTPAAADEAPRESDLRAAAKRFGADFNIVTRETDGLTAADFADVIDTTQKRIDGGNVRDSPALFVDLLQRKRKAAARVVQLRPVSIDDELAREAAWHERRGTDPAVAADLLEKQRRRLERERGTASWTCAGRRS
jgi:hypothetical protein